MYYIILISIKLRIDSRMSVCYNVPLRNICGKYSPGRKNGVAIDFKFVRNIEGFCTQIDFERGAKIDRTTYCLSFFAFIHSSTTSETSSNRMNISSYILQENGGVSHGRFRSFPYLENGFLVCAFFSFYLSVVCEWWVCYYYYDC